MKLQNLAKMPEAKGIKRVGRGPGSGMGKTSTRGHKGQNARSGGGVKPWFEGGQSTFFRRIPKRGFNNARFTTRYATINVSDLNKYFKDGETVTLEALKEKRIIKKELSGLKVLGNGDISLKVTVIANKLSESAITKIEKAGGKVEVI